MKKSLVIILVLAILIFGLGMWYYYENIYTSDQIPEINNQDKVENYSKLEKDKSIVYIEKEYNDDLGKSTLPIINIDSEDVKSMNNEIESKYNQYTSEDTEGNLRDTINLNNYYINNNILSVIYNDYSYSQGDYLSYIINNIDINTGKKINNEYLLELKGYTIEQVSEIAKSKALESFGYDEIEELLKVPEEDIENASELNKEFWNKYFNTDLYDEENIDYYYGILTAYKVTRDQEITIQNALFLNENGDLCVEINYGLPHKMGGFMGFVNIETGEEFTL